MDKQIVYAMTGEVKYGNKNNILKSGAIGSCIVITAYDKLNRIGAMAHLMLPRKANKNKNLQKTRYAFNAIEELMNVLKKHGANKNKIEVCLAGGANVLQRKDDSIGQNNISSVEEILRDKQIRIAARSLGGIERRCVSLDVETGCLNLSIGDSLEKLFWEFKSSKRGK